MYSISASRRAITRALVTVGLLLLALPVTATAAPKRYLYDDLPSGAQPSFAATLPWNHPNLTYAFVNGTADIPGDDERQAVRDAMKLWTDVTPLTFTETNPASAEIKISWAEGDHGDGSTFDGVDGVLAHAFYPTNGRVHFDDAETWTTSSRLSQGQPIDLVTVAAHELGHALGLQHTTDTTAIMYDYYSVSHRYLTTDDIQGIQSLYGGGGPTNTTLTLDGWLNGQPGYASVHGSVTGSGGGPVPGYVNVNFQRLVNGVWQTEISAHPTLSNGAYTVANQPGLGVGQWRVQTVFPDQGEYFTSQRTFEIKHGYQLVARHSGKCLDVSGMSTVNGQSIQQYDCLDPNVYQNQVFSLVPQSTGGVQLVARHSGRCVDVVNGSQSAGTGLQQWACLGASQANQIWVRDPIAPGSAYSTLRATHSGQCMDVKEAGTAAGVPVTQWPCTSGYLNQQWDLRPVNSSAIPTQSYLSVDQVLHGQPGYVTVSGNVQRSPIVGSGIPMGSGYVNVNFQKLVNGSWQTMSTVQRTLSNGSWSVDNWGVGVGEWRVRTVFPAGQGNFAEAQSEYRGFTIRPGYQIVNRYSNKCMSLAGNNGASGTGIIQWTCSPNPSPGDGQVMHRVPMPGGGWQLKINSTGKCVDVTGGSQSNGAWLQQWDCLGAGQTNQIWNVIPIAGQAPWLAFRAVHSQKCADVTGPSGDNGVRIQQWDCHWGGNQQWDMRPVG